MNVFLLFSSNVLFLFSSEALGRIGSFWWVPVFPCLPCDTGSSRGWAFVCTTERETETETDAPSGHTWPHSPVAGGRWQVPWCEGKEVIKEIMEGFWRAQGWAAERGLHLGSHGPWPGPTEQPPRIAVITARLPPVHSFPCHFFSRGWNQLGRKAIWNCGSFTLCYDLRNIHTTQLLQGAFVPEGPCPL